MYLLVQLMLTNEDYLIMSSQVIEGVVNFSHVTQHDVFNGQDTGMFSITITMSEDDAAALAAQGVKIKEYEGNKQRKFKSKYTIGMYLSLIHISEPTRPY